MKAQPGDILLITRDMLDKKTQVPYVWKFLAIVVQPKRSNVRLIRLDNLSEMDINIYDDRWSVRTIPEDSWPDGARVLRMRLIMEGRLDGLI